MIPQGVRRWFGFFIIKPIQAAHLPLLLRIRSPIARGSVSGFIVLPVKKTHPALKKCCHYRSSHLCSARSKGDIQNPKMYVSTRAYLNACDANRLPMQRTVPSLSTLMTASTNFTQNRQLLFPRPPLCQSRVSRSTNCPHRQSLE